MELAGQSVVVVGLARSGLAAARLLVGGGARDTATDRKGARELAQEVVRLEQMGVRLALGSHEQAGLDAADLVVVSPGVPWELPELERARAKGIRVIAELELGYRLLQGSVAAVTGTKGKSTTTAALGAMLRAAGGDVRVGGNIGDPLTGMVEGSSAATTFVLEVSSFQLEGTQSFHPRLAVFLNLSADHLDRHPSYEAYAQAKARVFANQTERDFAVVNADDPQVLALARAGRARVVAVSGERDPGGQDAAFFGSGAARLRLSGREEPLFPLAAVRLPGRHLAGDLLAAGAAARLLGAPLSAIARAVASFDGAEHVLERVAEIGGVVFFNDSKATNVAAAKLSLLAMERRTHAIVGGRYKGGDFTELREAAAGRVVEVLAIGEARERVAEALQAVAPVVRCDSLREAVERAFKNAAPGEAVLLAPACSSFDMFADYAERGRVFKQEVARLQAEASEAPRG
jgi:UDP-N-acetylmuramoylalanine--D-glutamate ligase